MGDDNEIRQLIHREAETFLKQARDQIKGVEKVYDFEEEFSKSKKNRSIFVVAGTILTILALGVAAFVTTKIINDRTQRTPIDVGAFEDLNLKDLLDQAKRNENDLSRAKLELAKLEDEYAAGLKNVEQDARAGIEALSAMNLSAEDELARKTAINAKAQADKAALRQKYAPLIAQKKAQIEALQVQVDKYDQRLAEQSKKQAELLNNQQRVFELEKQKLSTFYEGRISELDTARKAEAAANLRQREQLSAAMETRRQRDLADMTLKYNPILSDKRSLSLLEGWVRPAQPIRPAFPAYLGRVGIADAQTSAQLDRSEEDFSYLTGKLRAVPYINSVPPALSRAESEALTSMTAYREILDKASRGLEARDGTIAALEARSKTAEAALERYRWAVNEYVRDNREGGYILDPRNTSDISVALNNAFPIAAGTIGYVFRTGERPIANLVFFEKDGAIRAKATELMPGESIRPFDTILIKMSDSRLVAPPAPIPSPAAPEPAPSPAPVPTPEPAPAIAPTPAAVPVPTPNLEVQTAPAPENASTEAPPAAPAGETAPASTGGTP